MMRVMVLAALTAVSVVLTTMRVVALARATLMRSSGRISQPIVCRARLAILHSNMMWISIIYGTL
jgi:hypothetical protein